LPKAAQAQFSQVIQKITDATSQEISPAKIWETFEKTFINQSGPFKLISFTSERASRSNDLERMKATVEINGKSHQLEATGNGPIAAFIKGMRDEFNLAFRLKDYNEHTRTAGSESEAAAYIELKVPDENGQSVFGVGIDTSITLAPIKAVISAINRINSG
jgi:2-isopropylmalate synthase